MNIEYKIDSHTAKVVLVFAAIGVVNTFLAAKKFWYSDPRTPRS